MGFMEHGSSVRMRRHCSRLIEQGPGTRRSAAFSEEVRTCAKRTVALCAEIDFHSSFRGNVETQLKNTEGLNNSWIDELIWPWSLIRRSEGSRYTKEIYLPILRRCVDTITIDATTSPTSNIVASAAQRRARSRPGNRTYCLAIADKEMERKRHAKGFAGLRPDA